MQILEMLYRAYYEVKFGINKIHRQHNETKKIKVELWKNL